MMTSPPIVALVALSLCTACGAKSALDEHRSDTPERDASASDSGTRDSGADLGDVGSRVDLGPDFGTPDLGPPTVPCVTSCEFCTPRGPAVVLSEDWGQMPDPEWDGEKLLVAYDLRSPELVALVAVELDGTILWNEPIRGIQLPRVAFDREAGAGLVIFDGGLQWLGADGRPLGMVERLPPFANVSGEVAVTESGFLTMFARLSGPLHFHRVGRVPEPVRFGDVLEPRGSLTPEHVVDAAGRATFIVTSEFDASGSEGSSALYRVGASGPPELVADLGERGVVTGLETGPDGSFYLLRRGVPPETFSLGLERIERSGAVLSRTEFPSRALRQQLLRLGDSLVFTTTDEAIEGGSLVCANVRDPSSFTTTPYTEAPTPGSPRMVRVPRGFAITWGASDPPEFVQPMLQVYDCCVPE